MVEHYQWLDSKLENDVEWEKVKNNDIQLFTQQSIHHQIVFEWQATGGC